MRAMDFVWFQSFRWHFRSPFNQCCKVARGSTLNATTKMAARGAVDDDPGSPTLFTAENQLGEGLSQVPFIELQKVQEKIGSKEFSALLNRSMVPMARKRSAPSASTGKGMPREVTSKQPVSRYRQVVPVRKQRAVDPRFSEEYGQFDEDKFKKAYQFLDSVRQNEKDALCKELKRAKSKGRKAQLMDTLKQLEAKEKAQKKREEEKQLAREHNKIEHQLRREGRTPFFIKKSLSRRIQLAQKYKALKSEGKLDQYMEKRRKKNVQRDRKSFPSAKA